MSRFYDAQKTNDYLKKTENSIATYAEQANAVLSSFATFAGDDEQKGEQAEAVKELVGTGEKNLVDRMLDIQQQISEAGAHIREGFETGVDAAPDALIEEDTLLQIEDSFKGFYKTYDDLGTQIEDIATILQSKYGEYATFERPDFESGREAFKDFCGGAAAGGFLQECMEKLEDFDAAETSYLHGLGLDGLLSDFENTVNNTSAVFASLDMNDSSIAGETLENITLDANHSQFSHEQQEGATVTRLSQDELMDPGGTFADLYDDGSANDGVGEVEGVSLLGKLKEWHYGRNKLNDGLTEEEVHRLIEEGAWERMPDEQAIYHTPENAEILNAKYIPKSPLDRREIVLKPDGSIEKDPKYMGTPNYCPITRPEVSPPQESYGEEYERLFPDLAVDNSVNGGFSETSAYDSGYVGHFLLDVLPYWAFGNTSEDDSTILQRVVGFQAAHDMMNLSGDTFEAVNGPDENDFMPGR